MNRKRPMPIELKKLPKKVRPTTLSIEYGTDTNHMTLIADALLHGMTYNIEVAASGNDGDHPEEEARMRAAFGPKWRNNIDEIRQTAQAMRDQRLKINDANPETYDRELQKGSGVSTMI